LDGVENGGAVSVGKDDNLAPPEDETVVDAPVSNMPLVIPTITVPVEDSADATVLILMRCGADNQ
jgi:hypothetical protein